METFTLVRRDQTRKKIAIVSTLLVLLSAAVIPLLVFLFLIPAQYCGAVVYVYNAKVTRVTDNGITCVGNVTVVNRGWSHQQTVTIGEYRFLNPLVVGDVCPFDKVEQLAFSSRWTPFVGQQCTSGIITVTVLLSLTEAFLLLVYLGNVLYLGVLLARRRKMAIHDVDDVTVVSTA